jgi:hypothetical protein
MIPQDQGNIELAQPCYGVLIWGGRRFSSLARGFRRDDAGEAT